MNSKKSLTITIFCFAAGIIALAAGAFILMAAATEYNSGIGHFAIGSVFAPCAFIALALGTVCGGLLWFLMRGTRSEQIPEGVGTVGSFAYAFSSFLMLAAVGFDLYDRVFEVKPGYNVLVYAAAVLGVFSAIYLLLCALNRANDNGARLFSLLPPLYFAARVLILYFDKTVAINSPMKIITQLTFIALMLFFVAEAGIKLGRDKIFPRYTGICVCSVVFSGAAAISSLIASVFGTQAYELTLADSCLLAALTLLCIVRLATASDSAIWTEEETEYEDGEE